MKSFIAGAAALLSFAAATEASQSSAFELVVHSTNKTLNGAKFGTCHEGAAIESVCIYPNDTARFYLNTTGTSKTGDLIWFLPTSTTDGTLQVPQSLSIGGSPLNSNVLHPQFGFGDSTPFGFDKKNRLYATSYVDDSVTPPKAGTEQKLYNWFVCETNTVGYVYNTLSWVLGKPSELTPTNPSCQKVTVTRLFVGKPAQ